MPESDEIGSGRRVERADYEGQDLEICKSKGLCPPPPRGTGRDGLVTFKSPRSRTFGNF